MPKSKLSGLLDLTRLLKTILKSRITPVDSVVLMGDSECSIAMCDKPGSSLSPYFCNRVGEIKANLSEAGEYSYIEPLQHIPGHLNPSDLPTRGLAKPQDISADSVWQVGPDFLRSPRECWPTHRPSSSNIPIEVKRVKVATVGIWEQNLSSKQKLLIPHFGIFG